MYLEPRLSWWTQNPESVYPVQAEAGMQAENLSRTVWSTCQVWSPKMLNIKLKKQINWKFIAQLQLKFIQKHWMKSSGLSYVFFLEKLWHKNRLCASSILTCLTRFYAQAIFLLPSELPPEILLVSTVTWKKHHLASLPRLSLNSWYTCY